MIKKTAIQAAALAVFIILLSCSGGKKNNDVNILKGKKVFYLDSYHRGYEPNIPSWKVIDAALSSKGIIIQEFYMNTKFENTSKEISAVSDEAVESIRKFSPDLIIAADDPAMDYVICPFLAGSKIPVVFTGTNWKAPECADKSPNVTGQIEVEFIVELIDFLRPYAKSERIFFLQGDTETDRQSIDYYVKYLGIKTFKSVFVSDFESWKKEYRKLQEVPGIVILRNNSGIRGWQGSDAAEFAFEVTKNPSGSVSAHMRQFCLVSYAKDKYEFGEYASKTALDILKGKKILPLPLEKNERVKKILNMKMAKKLGIVFPFEVVEESDFAEEAHE